MRALLGLAAVILLLAVCGWITFSWNGNRASVNIETEQVESDTEQLVDEGQELLKEIGSETSVRDQPVTPPVEGDLEPTDSLPAATEASELEGSE